MYSHSKNEILKLFWGKGLREYYCNVDNQIITFMENGICPKCGCELILSVGWTEEWQPFHKHYEKTYVDIITKIGIQFDKCWPNAGNMIPAAISYIEIPYEDVKLVRLH